MLNRSLKRGVFVLEWLNIFATAYYFNYLFFHMKEQFGFSNQQNLLLAAVNGFVYVAFSVLGGKFAQRHGYFRALKAGFVFMALAMLAAIPWQTVFGQYAMMFLWTFGVCFTWPALEALASENEDRAGLSRMVGIYNVTWASGAAVAYFTGGTLLGILGKSSLYYLPALVHATQLIIVVLLERKARQIQGTTMLKDSFVPLEDSRPVAPALAQKFLRMAWLANPFAYIAMNTVIPLIPDVASKLELTKASAGFVGSVWMFARLFAFFTLWKWQGWHYHFGWLVSAYAGMIISFAAILLMPTLAGIVLAQLLFGFSVGLIYYSSLFYSMDVGETRGEHGGFHEALIGVGLFLGPAFGAGALFSFPEMPNIDTKAVAGLLVVGFVVLVVLSIRKQKMAANKS